MKKVIRKGKAQKKTNEMGKLRTRYITSIIPFGPYEKGKAVATRLAAMKQEKGAKVSGLHKMRGGYGFNVTLHQTAKYPDRIKTMYIKAHLEKSHPNTTFRVK